MEAYEVRNCSVDARRFHCHTLAPDQRGAASKPRGQAEVHLRVKGIKPLAHPQFRFAQGDYVNRL